MATEKKHETKPKLKLMMGEILELKMRMEKETETETQHKRTKTIIKTKWEFRREGETDGNNTRGKRG